MAKIYSKENFKTNETLKPKAETIDFLLNYSKSISILKTDNYLFEVNKN